jgi:hypothetical protein
VRVEPAEETYFLRGALEPHTRRRLAAGDPSDSDPDSDPDDSRPNSDPDDSQSDALEEFEPESELLAARLAFLLHFSQWPAY